jgi:hypothetical protein
MGDRERSWRVKPFQMSPGGPFWVPPPLPTVSSDSEEEREKEQQKERERRRKEAREREAAAEKEGAAKDDKYKYTTGETQCIHSDVQMYTLYIAACLHVGSSKVSLVVVSSYNTELHAIMYAIVVLWCSKHRIVLSKVLQSMQC